MHRFCHNPLALAKSRQYRSASHELNEWRHPAANDLAADQGRACGSKEAWREAARRSWCSALAACSQSWPRGAGCACQQSRDRVCLLLSASWSATASRHGAASRRYSTTDASHCSRRKQVDSNTGPLGWEHDSRYKVVFGTISVFDLGQFSTVCPHHVGMLNIRPTTSCVMEPTRL